MTDFKFKLLRLDELDFNNTKEVKKYYEERVSTFNYLDKCEVIFFLINRVKINKFFIELATYEPFHSYYAVKYRKNDITKDILEILENNIALSARTSFLHSKTLGGRFPKGETSIISDPYYKDRYLSILKSYEKRKN